MASVFVEEIDHRLECRGLRISLCERRRNFVFPTEFEAFLQSPKGAPRLRQRPRGRPTGAGQYVIEEGEATEADGEVIGLVEGGVGANPTENRREIWQAAVATSLWEHPPGGGVEKKVRLPSGPGVVLFGQFNLRPERHGADSTSPVWRVALQRQAGRE